MLNQNFAHLHVHNEYSLLDGLGKAEEYVARAKELGFYYLALTNHGNIDGLISFQKACRKQKITPVFGCELYICPGKASSKEGRHNYHITTLVRNQAGWNTLCRMLSFANLEGFYYRPRIGIEDLLDFDLSGLTILTGCANSVLMCEGGIELIQAIQEQYENVFLEIMPHQTPEQKEHYQVIKLLIKTFPVVATNDCHYVMEGDSLPQEVLLAVQRSAKWSDPKRFKFDIKGLHLRSAEEMVDAFQEQDFYPEETWRLALSNTVRVAKMCGPFQIRKRQINLPTVPKHEGKEPDLLLTKLCYDGLFSVRDRNLINEVELEEYKERMMTELDLIKSKGFSNYFLIVKELLDWCKETGIMYGPGRGSVGGSMVAYLLGITNIDPIKFDLLFDRFINKDRIDYPDIDLDFEDIYRGRVRKHLEETYGENNVAGLSTFLEMKGRMVIRDVGRVFDLPSYEIDAFAKSLWSKDDNAKILGEAKTGEGRALADEHPEEYAVAERLEQQIRGVGQHAAAVIVSRDDLTETNRGHLCKRNDHLVMNWDMGDAEYMGLMKLDILGLATLTVLNECSRLVGGIDFNSIPLDDGEVLASITADNLAGLFQLSGKATADLLNHIKIKSFNDIVIIITASRPGPADSGMTAEYIKRRGGGGIRKEHPLYQEATKETLGVVLFQEQMMAIMNKVAGLSYSTADNIRKVIGKKRDKKEFEPYRQGFISGCLRNKTMSGREASLFWEGLLEWARYGFNRCLTGDTLVYRSSANQFSKKEVTVEELYGKWQEKSDSGKALRYRGLQIMQMDEDKRARPGTLKGVHLNGIKKVYEIEASSGAKIKATENHRFLSPSGYKTVRELKAGDKLFILPKFKRGRQKTGLAIRGQGVTYFSTKPGFCGGKGNPGYIDGRDIALEKAKQIVLLRSKGECEKCGANRGRMEFAHINSLESYQGDFLKYHNSRNILRLCNPCHKSFDYKKGERKVRYSRGVQMALDTIKAIKYVGYKKVYDLEMDTPQHNFIANRFVSHNSHAVGYAMLGYWTAYCKVRYPKEFICAALAYGKDKEGYKADLVKYAIKVGLTVSPPKVGKSDSIKWTAIDGVLYAPFIEIKGIGEKTALELSQRKEVQLGFFSRPEMEKLAATKGNTKTSALLSKVGAYGDDIPEGVQEYFSFPISVKDSKWKWLPLEGDRLRFPKGLITSKHYRDLHILACTKCNLAKECSKPVLTSIGQTNTVILGEGPGKNEDLEGLPFVGDSGEVLWESLNRLGYKREFFHIMNVVRCWPSESKTPSQEQIETCFPWSAYELRQIDCKLILALGNTPLVALTDKPGITKKTGTTEWVERVGAWVCWCVHPSWVLRGNDQDIFDKGIDNFVKRLRFLRRNK
ncbi:MAG: DNA polymerase III subunit alpha [Syntrophorhabdaceae bacterium]|nr:DNA polymerase III subunit alpha [Syntrophorhabdaceae bacterium]